MKTPGTSWGMYCDKGMWDFDPYTCREEEFRVCLDTAQTCPHWKLREELR